ncbi:MAG: class I SAM-dependent methyltransferase [Thiolinea sp.]
MSTNSTYAVVSECVPAVRQWYESVAGRNTAAAVQAAVAEMSNDVFGYYAAQVGELAGEYSLLQDSRIRYCFAVAFENGTEGVDLVADPAALPLAFDNLDLIVASHVLDCTTLPHQVLREIERVLVPEGHCILIAFNPFSARGLKLVWQKLRNQKNTQSLYTAFRLRDWFEVLGFDVLEVRSVGQYDRFEKLPVIRKFGWLQRLLTRYYRFFGQVQLIHVQKKVSKLTPWQPKPAKRPILKPGMAVNSNGVGKTANHTNELYKESTTKGHE